MGCKKCNGKDSCRVVKVCECPIKDLQTDCSLYTGKDLDNINVKSGTILTTVLEKIGDYFERLKEYVDKSFEIENVGEGVTLYRGNHNVDGTKEIKTLIAGENVVIEESFNKKEITISATASGGGGVEYIPGENISISEDNVISSTDTKYTQGENVSISESNVISSTDTKYFAGQNITIDPDTNTISSTAGGGGVTNTATSLGDNDIYKDTVGTEFRFRGLTTEVDSPIILEEAENNISIGIDPESIKRVVNQDGIVVGAVDILREDEYKIKRLNTTQGTGLIFKDNGTHITLSKAPNNNIWDNVIVGPISGVSNQLGNTFESIAQLRDALAIGRDNILLPNSSLTLVGGTSESPVQYTGAMIPNISNIVIPRGSIARLDIENEVLVTPLGFSGGGEVIIESLSTNSELVIDDITVSSTGLINGGVDSNIQIVSSRIGNAKTISTEGNVTVRNSTFLKAKEEENPVDAVISTVGPESTVIIETSTIEEGNIVDIDNSSGAIVEIKGSTIRGTAGTTVVLGSKPGDSVRSFGNILGKSKIVEPEQAVESYGDITDDGINQNLRVFENRGRAITEIGPNKLFLNTEGKGPGEVFVDYTYETTP